jgi:hypothetical protein
VVAPGEPLLEPLPVPAGSGRHEADPVEPELPGAPGHRVSKIVGVHGAIVAPFPG